MAEITKKIGLPPGTLMHIGPKRTGEAFVSLIQYNKTDSSELKPIKYEVLNIPFDGVQWVNIDGVHDIKAVQDAGEIFGIDELILEDIVNTETRPKIEYGEDQICMHLKMIGINPNHNTIEIENLSLFLKNNRIASFQETQGDVLDYLRDRILKVKSKILQYDADFLFYRIVDTVIDNYYYVVEHYNNRIEKLEEKILTQPSQSVISEIQALKKDLIKLRYISLATKDALGKLLKDAPDIITDESQIFLKDVYEHLTGIYEQFESQKDMLSNLMDLYLSMVSHRMNQVMQILTLVSVIFIPLTFMAGIYGMNFEHMPELAYPYAYPTLIGTMLIVAITTYWIYRKKGWLTKY